MRAPTYTHTHTHTRVHVCVRAYRRSHTGAHRHRGMRRGSDNGWGSPRVGTGCEGDAPPVHAMMSDPAGTFKEDSYTTLITNARRHLCVCMWLRLPLYYTVDTVLMCGAALPLPLPPLSCAAAGGRIATGTVMNKAGEQGWRRCMGGGAAPEYIVASREREVTVASSLGDRIYRLSLSPHRHTGIRHETIASVNAPGGIPVCQRRRVLGLAATASRRPLRMCQRRGGI
eukprot:GHVU01023261.1.p1 GENE.GHVU01023261.1~~GHVU01023261.1.p1  ORF type:complete len:228 (-),score=14.79 GHVU01023261.1:149-832(-)